MTPACSPRGSAVPDKATLFCPECDHSSRFDDDWHVVETASAAHYRCPDCGTEITARPSQRPVAPWHPDAVWQLWDASVRVWQSVWRTSMPFP